jgi:pimeloyl-[acyl-carrier protein] methyl ester esterase
VSRKNFILLRGWVRNQFHWEDFPEVLKKASPKSRVICLDFPGNGVYHHKKSFKTVAQNTLFLKKRFERLKELHPNEQWYLVGLSLGGMITMDWANQYPDDFNGVVVINSSSNKSNFLDRLKPNQVRRILNQLMIELKTKDFEEKSLLKEQFAIEMTQNHFPAQLYKKWSKIDLSYPVSKSNLLAQAVAAIKFSPPKEIIPPVLILCSKADRMVDWSCSLELAKHYEIEPTIHNSGGHDLTNDDPDWCVEKILSFVS